MEDRVKEIATDRYIVRIHYGKLSDAELRTRLEEASINFYKAIKRAGKESEIPCSTPMIR